ncbi:cytochrome-c peroxidase [Cellulophaga sp. E6(2014)]|uniref:cytochrome-c peroxidase n=1 Tax=Cellulophaga sp. E6(2014) TaxID=1495334 RepID=UPI00051D3762|nr:cytochrome c peroxidase [Cellulophaga sp. E6(2014)]KGK29151.1 cytochrome C peroxidase [Cellulophaga sp. E6(2014)]
MKKILIFFSLLLIISCSNDAEYVAVNEALVFEQPSNFPALVYDLEANPPTEMGFELGKKLFYDGNLSRVGYISCGFCHEQNSAFTHHGHQFSHGVDDLEGTRNTPSIQNMAYMSHFMWDGAIDHLDLFPIAPITNAVEMDETITNVLAKLAADTEYQQLFSEAFVDGEVTMEYFLKALSQFMVMMVSSNSKYDKYVRNEDGITLSITEQEGLVVFESNCASCHATDLFTDNSFRNNGLAPNAKLDDTGRYLATSLEADKYKFKVPSLRNVALTAPYMHDGRFGSLEAVLDFYTDGVVASTTLDPELQHNDAIGIPLTDTDKIALVAFLNTLTDEEYIDDERFAEF